MEISFPTVPSGPLQHRVLYNFYTYAFSNTASSAAVQTVRVTLFRSSTGEVLEVRSAVHIPGETLAQTVQWTVPGPTVVPPGSDFFFRGEDLSAGASGLQNSSDIFEIRQPVLQILYPPAMNDTLTGETTSWPLNTTQVVSLASGVPLSLAPFFALELWNATRFAVLPPLHFSSQYIRRLVVLLFFGQSVRSCPSPGVPFSPSVKSSCMEREQRMECVVCRIPGTKSVGVMLYLYSTTFLRTLNDSVPNTFVEPAEVRSLTSRDPSLRTDRSNSVVLSIPLFVSNMGTDTLYQLRVLDAGNPLVFGDSGVFGVYELPVVEPEGRVVNTDALCMASSTAGSHKSTVWLPPHSGVFWLLQWCVSLQLACIPRGWFGTCVGFNQLLLAGM